MGWDGMRWNESVESAECVTVQSVKSVEDPMRGKCEKKI